jgi:hypothetical protein
VRKLIVLIALLVGAGYVATHWFGLVGPQMLSNASTANEVLDQGCKERSLRLCPLDLGRRTGLERFLQVRDTKS